MSFIYDQLDSYDIARRLRSDEYAGWSYWGALALGEWLEDYARDIGEPVELDHVALRCEFQEFESIEEACEEYSLSESEFRDECPVIIEHDEGIVCSYF